MLLKYYKNIIFIVMTLSFFTFAKANKNPLIGERWVIINYDNPFDGVSFSLINDTTQKIDCSNYYIIEFQKKGKILINMNNKITSKGSYSIKGKEITINPRIDLQYYDIDKKCKLTTEKRIILSELLLNTKSFEIIEGTLILYFIHTKNQTEGKIELIKQSRLS